MRKTAYFWGAMICMTMLTVGCGSGTEGPQPAVAVSPTATVTREPMPTEPAMTEQPVPTEPAVQETPMLSGTVVVASEALPIDDEHFGDEAFCKILKRNFDTDENGYLSEEEAAEVKSLNFPPNALVGTLKGFSYFPNLESVVLPPVERVEFVGVPSLKKISNSTGGIVNQRNINFLLVSDCPELEQMVFTDVTVDGGENDIENFLIGNCPKLKLLEFSLSGLSNMRGRITGAPALTVDFDVWTEAPERLIMDGAVIVADSSLEYDCEKMKLRDEGNLSIQWTTEENDARVAAWQQLHETVEEIKQDFYLTIEETKSAVYDENGAQAYYVFLDHASMKPERYYDHYEGERNYATANCFLVYAKKHPEAEQFTMEWLDSGHYELYEYSPVSDIKGEYYSDFAVRHVTGDGNETVETFRLNFDYSVSEQGEIQLLPRGYLLWNDEISAEDVWQPRTEPVVPSAPAEDDIPIDKQYFSDVFMRRYIKAVIDTDGNGYLSKEEREAVTEIDMFEMEMGLDVIDGFEWFPNLESISLPNCTEMVIRNCPNLVYVGASEGDGADKLTIENCPKLKEMYFVYAGVSNLFIKDCENLRCISDYCAWDVSLYDTVWEFVNCPKLTVATGISGFGKLLIADADEVSLCFLDMLGMEVSYKDGMFLLNGENRVKWKNLPEDWFLPSEELLSESFVTDALKKHFDAKEIQYDYSRLLMYSPGKGADYLVDVVHRNPEKEGMKGARVRCCIWITPEKEVMFYDSFETWNAERVPEWSEW